MGSMFKLLGASVGLALLLAAALVFSEASEGAKLQAKFFESATSGEPKKLLAMFHPALREQLDEHLLAEWMNVVASRLGALRGVTGGTFLTAVRDSDGLASRVSEGAAAFEHGQASARLTFKGDLLTAFDVESPQLSPGTYDLPADTQHYRKKGLKLLELLLRGRIPEAHAMLHPTLRAEIPADVLEAQIAALSEKMADAESIRFTAEERTKESGLDTLVLRYRIETTSGPFEGEVKFQFVRFESHLRAFNIKSASREAA